MCNIRSIFTEGINSHSPHLSSRAGRSADIFLGSDASSGLRQQIYTARALTALDQSENITLYENIYSVS